MHIFQRKAAFESYLINANMAPNMRSVDVKDKKVKRNNGWFLSKESWLDQKEESWMVQKKSWLIQEILGKQICKSTLTAPFQTNVRYVFN